jgi:transposase InsO family protein
MVNHKRVYRLCRDDGLSLGLKHPRRHVSAPTGSASPWRSDRTSYGRWTSGRREGQIEAWRRQYNESRPHTALGWMTLREFALVAARMATE